MLCLTFTIGDNEYAINSKEIHEILPLVKVYPLPKPSNQFIGYINYRGNPVPVLDLSVFLGYLPTEAKMSTRILIIEFLQEDGNQLFMGVLVYNATELEKFELENIIQPDIDVRRHPLIDKIIMQGNRALFLLSFRSLKTLQLET